MKLYTSLQSIDRPPPTFRNMLKVADSKYKSPSTNPKLKIIYREFYYFK